MKTIYMQQTLELISQLNIEFAKHIVNVGAIKELDNLKYVVIDEKE